MIHFAALKPAGESCAQPLAHFDNNIPGTISLLRAMRRRRGPVFSSVVAGYGEPRAVPIDGDASLSTIPAVAPRW